jgi:hypothetical protein
MARAQQRLFQAAALAESSRRAWSKLGMARAKSRLAE